MPSNLQPKPPPSNLSSPYRFRNNELNYLIIRTKQKILLFYKVKSLKTVPILNKIFLFCLSDFCLSISWIYNTLLNHPKLSVSFQTLKPNDSFHCFLNLKNAVKYFVKENSRWLNNYHSNFIWMQFITFGCSLFLFWSLCWIILIYTFLPLIARFYMTSIDRNVFLLLYLRF